MKLNIPWINSRKRFLLASICDGLINIIFYSFLYSTQFNSYPNFIVTLSMSFFWIILSYILGRYKVCKKNDLREVVKSIVKANVIFLLCNLTYLCLNWSSKFLILLFSRSNVNLDLTQSQNIFFLKTTFIISLFSCFLQYFLNILSYRINNQSKYWLFYGSIIDLSDFKKEIRNLKNNVKLKRIGVKTNFNKIDYEKIEGIVIGNNVDMTQNDIDKIFYLKSKGFNVINVLNWCEIYLHRIPPYMINNKFKIIEKFNSIDESYNIRVKRIGDFIVSLFLLFITLPLSILTALFIYLEDFGPIFYSQVRTGFRGEKIIIYKFRSMIKNAEKKGPQWAKNEDKRITKIGKIIRATRIDELPQLLSVLDGTMSLIGPRPERPVFEEKFLEEIPFYKYRTIVKPGISGWAQVNYPYGASLEDSINKLSYDIYYINHISFLLDLLILIKTIKTVFNAKGLVSLK